MRPRPGALVAVVSQPALRSAGRARSRPVARGAVRRVEGVAPALRASLSFRMRTGYAQRPRCRSGRPTPPTAGPRLMTTRARRHGRDYRAGTWAEVARLFRPRRRRYERGCVAPGPVRRVKRREKLTFVFVGTSFALPVLSALARRVLDEVCRDVLRPDPRAAHSRARKRGSGRLAAEPITEGDDRRLGQERNPLRCRTATGRSIACSLSV